MSTALRTALSITGVAAFALLHADAPRAAQPPTRRMPAAVATDIDRLIEARLTAAKLPLSPQADDAEFLRRASLDITGRIPTAERAAAFLADNSPDKRQKLIDELLADHAYGEHFGTIWYHRMIKSDDDNRLLVANNKLAGWLGDRFNRNQSWDQLVSDLLTASGDRDKHPETVFFLAHVGDAKAGQPEPSKLTAAATRLFLGVRLECCECHNHPFTKLQQTDFWSMAAFFTTTHASESAKKDARAGTVPSVYDGNPTGKVARKAAGKETAPAGSIVIPDSGGKTVKAKLLGAAQAAPPSGNRLRAQLAAWMTGRSNPYFARAAVNKLWGNFFGRGIVTPIDDMRPEAEATHPEILQLLAGEFVACGFDQKHLIRCICLSKTYQRGSRVLPENKADETLYSHMPLKMMTADMLFDSLAVALGHPTADRDKASGKQKYARTARDQFRKFFHAEADDDVGVVEDYTHGVPQVLRLMNSSQMNDTTGVVSGLMKMGGPEKVIEGLFLRVLARRPTEVESKRMQAYVAGDKDSARAYGDLMWVLLNSGEFMFNH
jgi:hypothetical protein